MKRSRQLFHHKMSFHHLSRPIGHVKHFTKCRLIVSAIPSTLLTELIIFIIKVDTLIGTHARTHARHHHDMSDMFNCFARGR